LGAGVWLEMARFRDTDGRFMNRLDFVDVVDLAIGLRRSKYAGVFNARVVFSPEMGLDHSSQTLQFSGKTSPCSTSLILVWIFFSKFFYVAQTLLNF